MQHLSLGPTVYPSRPQLPRLLRVDWAKACKESVLTLAVKALLGPAISSGPVTNTEGRVPPTESQAPSRTPNHKRNPQTLQPATGAIACFLLLHRHSPIPGTEPRGASSSLAKGFCCTAHTVLCPQTPESQEPPCHPAPTSGPGPGQPAAASPSHTGRRLEVENNDPYCD